MRKKKINGKRIVEPEYNNTVRYRTNNYRTSYHDTIMCDEIHKLSERDDVFGVLPWKLFYMRYHKINKEVGYVNKYVGDRIEKIISLVSKCNLMTNDNKNFVL